MKYHLDAWDWIAMLLVVVGTIAFIFSVSREISTLADWWVVRMGISAGLMILGSSWIAGRTLQKKPVEVTD